MQYRGYYLTGMKDTFLKCNGQYPDIAVKCGLLVCPVYTVHAYTTARNIAIALFNFIILKKTAKKWACNSDADL
jgi:hypothetical protein